MKTLMIVDDSNIMRKTLELTMRNFKLDLVATAENGRDAVRLFEKHRPEIVTLDITMPEMDRLEALDQMMKINKEAVVIIVSALNDKGSVLQAITRGAKTYLTKPVSREKLEAALVKFAGDAI